MKAIFLLALVAAASAVRWHELHSYSFHRYALDHGKQYLAHEVEMRKALFDQRLEEIRAHNSDTSKTWKEGVNHLTDRTPEELRHLRGLKTAPRTLASAAPKLDVRPTAELPDFVDWRMKHVVSPVKDQGQCGSCWTFATVETIESHAALATGRLNILSEQQILDCTPNPDQCGGTGGCNGGTAELAMAQIIKTGGLMSEWTYPYISYWGQNGTCQFRSNQVVVKLSNYTTLPSNEYLPLMNAVAQLGPIAISVDASAWFKYESGVFNGCNQTNPDIDHAVQLVGYGTDPQLGDYWLVRNSWSPQWGEDGYIRIHRTDQQQCGTDINPADGTGCKDGPPTVQVCGTCGILYDSSYPTIAN